MSVPVVAKKKDKPPFARANRVRSTNAVLRRVKQLPPIDSDLHALLLSAVAEVPLFKEPTNGAQ